MSQWLAELNEAQLKAVQHQTGPLFVVAGAGTGKTKALTTRIAYLIDSGVKPERILALTFTNKAAREMKERVIQIVGPQAVSVTLSTFHSFCANILRKEIEKLDFGYTTRFNIIDEEDAKQIIRKIIKSLNLDVKRYKVKDLRDKISDYKHFSYDRFTDIEERSIYTAYCQELIDNNLLDFDDLQRLVQQLFRNCPNVKTYYRSLYEHILVDEFQDTDAIQYEILCHLMKDNGEENIFVVGDPDQSIYAFRGANYGNQKKFIVDFREAKVILDTNYRSTNNILAVANSLIRHNEDRVFTKDLASNLGLGKPVSISEYFNAKEEASNVVQTIKGLLKQNYQNNDIAILYRTNVISRIFEDALIKAGLPYRIYGGLSFYQRKEIKDILAYVRLVIDTDLDFYLKRIINTPTRGIGDLTVNKLEKHAINAKLSMFDAIDSFATSIRGKQALLWFTSLIKDIRQKLVDTTDLGEVVRIIAEDSGIVKYYLDQGDDEALERLANIYELVNVFTEANDYYAGNLVERLIQLLDQIALYTDKDQVDTKNAILLSTIHQVKGLEFKVVFMPAMEEGIFPSDHHIFDQADLEEERRVAYVGITRAKQRLYLSSAKSRMHHGAFKFQIPSRFIIETQKKTITNSKTMPHHTEDPANPFVLNDKVRHASFGLGRVVEVKEDLVRVAFAMPHGVKTLLATHPSIVKVSD